VASSSSRLATGERLAGFIYGTIIVLSVIVAGSRAYPHESGHIAAVAAATCVVFWLAHVYAHSVGHSVGHEEHLSLREVRYIARRESSIVQAAVPPIVVLVLGAAGVLSAHVALWLAFILGLIVLALQGFVFARIERLGLLGTVAVIAVNLGLGVLLVGLKLAVSH